MAPRQAAQNPADEALEEHADRRRKPKPPIEAAIAEDFAPHLEVDVAHCFPYGEALLRRRLKGEKAEGVSHGEEQQNNSRDAKPHGCRLHACSSSALALKRSMSLSQPPGASTCWRIVFPSPWRSKQRCSSSTQVVPSSQGVNLTSTSLHLARSGSNFQSGVICQAMTNRVGGSQITICPHWQSVPSACSL